LFDIGEEKMTQRIMVRLVDLKPNPFKKEIQDGKLDLEKVARLEESIGLSGFWDGLVARKRGSFYEVAFGHHRLQAAINKLGEDYKTAIQINDYSDEQMVIMLANENATDEGESFAVQVDTAVMASRHLKAHPEWCKILIQGESELKRAGQPHAHGSERCVSAFLGTRNWSQSTVHRYLAASGLVEEAKQNMADQNSTTARRPVAGVIGTGAAASVAGLSKPAQQELVKAVKNEDVALPTAVIKDAISAATAQAAQAAKPEQKAAVEQAVKKLDVSKATVAAVTATATAVRPAAKQEERKKAEKEIAKTLEKNDVSAPVAAATAKKIVDGAQDAAIEKQREATRLAIERAAEQQRRAEELRLSKNINDVVQSMTNALMGFEFPLKEKNDDKSLEKVIGQREFVEPKTLRGLVDSLRLVGAKFYAYAERLERPSQKKLSS